MTENHGCLLDADDYCGGAAIFVFDLCHQRTNGHHNHQMKTGNVDLEVSFSKPLPEAISLICYSSYDSIIAITKERNILIYWSESLISKLLDIQMVRSYTRYYSKFGNYVKTF